MLIGINVAVWLRDPGHRRQHAAALLDELALLPGTSATGSPTGSVVLVKGVADGAYWQVLTSVFTHGEVLHIGFNMLALYFLGPMLEQVLGRARFLALYLVSGIAGVGRGDAVLRPAHADAWAPRARSSG